MLPAIDNGRKLLDEPRPDQRPLLGAPSNLVDVGYGSNPGLRYTRLKVRIPAST